MWLAGLGALAYSSWPLAFLVCPALAGTALSSSFEARSQPFSWLFILLDCITGLAIATVGLRELHRWHAGPRDPGVVVFAFLGYSVFGVATAVDAVVPLKCGTASPQACARQVWPPTPDDVLTGVAMLALFLAAALVVFRMTRQPAACAPALPAAMTVTLIGWCVLGVMVLFSSARPIVIAVYQYAFLTLTSAVVFVVPLCVLLLRDAQRGASDRRSAD